MNDKKTMCCSVCKGDNISWRVWADENNNVLNSCEDKHCYCDDCEEETSPMMKNDDQSWDEVFEGEAEALNKLYRDVGLPVEDREPTDDQSVDEILKKDVEDTSMEEILKIADYLDKKGGE